MTATPSARGGRNGTPRKGRTNPQPHDPEPYPARNAIERGLGWLQRGRRVTTRYDQYAHRFLGFLYLAEAWIWLQSYLNTTWTERADRLNPRPSRADDNRDIDCMIIYYVWLKSCLNATWTITYRKPGLRCIRRGHTGPRRVEYLRCRSQDMFAHAHAQLVARRRRKGTPI